MKTLAILPSGEWCEITKSSDVKIVDMSDEDMTIFVNQEWSSETMLKLAKCNTPEKAHEFLKGYK